MVADLIKRQVFSGEKPPVLSLWADRWSGKSFFDNPYNVSTLKTIAYVNRAHPLKLLIVDDAVCSSTTIVQAIEFINRTLPDNVDIIFTPLVCRDASALESISSYLPFSYDEGRAFLVTKETYFSLIESSCSFPYKPF
jgi:hypothetical protein